MWKSDLPAWLRPRTENSNSRDRNHSNSRSCSCSSCFSFRQSSYASFRPRLLVAVLVGVGIFLLATSALVLFYAHSLPPPLHDKGKSRGSENEKIENPEKPGKHGNTAHMKGEPPAPFRQPEVPPFNETAAANFEKPADFRIVALVFYGRRDRVSVLDCYLQRNLVRNGGLLDEVLFLSRTDDAADLDWLDRKVEATPGYTKTDGLSNDGKNATVSSIGWDFSDMWRVARRGVMYVKIDDDVLFIEDAAIPSIVHRRLQRPDAYLVSANVVNHNRFSWLHRKIGAVLPYLPDPKPLHRPPPHGQFFKYSWRASSLPAWPGKQHTFDRKPFDPPSKQHRWLPTYESNIDNTPAAGTEEPSGTAGTKDWMVAAQELYSLLHRLETGGAELDVYRFPLWDLDYERMSINFFAVWGDDIVSSRPIAADDEKYLTMTAPKALGRRKHLTFFPSPPTCQARILGLTIILAGLDVIADGRGLVAHFSYGKQREGIEKTDVLARYRAYADEIICPKNK